MTAHTRFCESRQQVGLYKNTVLLRCRQPYIVHSPTCGTDCSSKKLGRPVAFGCSFQDLQAVDFSIGQGAYSSLRPQVSRLYPDENIVLCDLRLISKEFKLSNDSARDWSRKRLLKICYGDERGGGIQ